MAKTYSLDGKTPVIDPAAFVHPEGVLIGDVVVGPACYIGPCACLRGDFGPIRLEAGAVVQDTYVIHTFPEQEVRIEAGGLLGHGAVIHGCTIKKNAMVGINAVVMDRAVVGENTLVAAGALVRAGLEIPAGCLAAGVPAKIIRPLTAPAPPRPDERVSWFVYVVVLPADVDRESVIGKLSARGVQTARYLPCIHLQPYMQQRFGFRVGLCPVAEEMSARTLALPFHARLDQDDQEYVAVALAAALGS